MGANHGVRTYYPRQKSTFEACRPSAQVIVRDCDSFEGSQGARLRLLGHPYCFERTTLLGQCIGQQGYRFQPNDLPENTLPVSAFESRLDRPTLLERAT